MKFKNLFVIFFAFFSGCAARLSTQEFSKPSNQGLGQEVDPGLSHPPFEPFNLKQVSETYRQRYGITDPYTKLVNNKGDLYENLYGVRNFRVVLHGVYYRGGANNSFNKNEVRDNMNPLPHEGLSHLCEEGFKNAIYLYPDNYTAAPKKVSCKDFGNSPRTLDYLQINGLSSGNEEKFIALIYQRIKGKIDGPLYGHCWNGWHASGYVASITLKQFCGYTDQQALDYWIKNTDGDSNYEKIKQKVKSWKPLEKYKISNSESALICP